MDREALLRLLRDREVVLAMAEALASVPEAAGALLRAAGPEAAAELLRKAAESPGAVADLLRAAASSPEAVKAFVQILSRPEVVDAVFRAAGVDAVKALVEAVGKSPEAAARLASVVAPHIAVPLNVATREDVRQAVEELKKVMVTREEFQKAMENLVTKEDAKHFATKEDLQQFATREDLKNFATKDDIKALADRVAAVEAAVADVKARMVTREYLDKRVGELGARWGLVAEEAFREGVKELLREVGYVVERWTYYDGEGYVYGRGSEVDLDVVVRDGRVFVVEVTSSLKRGDLQAFRRRAELYEGVTGRRVDGVYAVTAFIHDRRPEEVRRLAEELGIRVVAPEELCLP